MRKAFVYVTHEDRRYGIPSSAYVRICQQGYREFGFDDDLLDEALVFSASNAVEADADTYEEVW